MGCLRLFERKTRLPRYAGKRPRYHFGLDYILHHAYGLEYQQVTTLPDLIYALDDAAETTGLRIIEAVTTRTTRAALHHQLSH